MRELLDLGDLVDDRTTISLTFELNSPEEEERALVFAQNYQRGEICSLRGINVKLVQVVYLPSDVTDSDKAELKLVVEALSLLY